MYTSAPLDLKIANEFLFELAEHVYPQSVPFDQVKPTLLEPTVEFKFVGAAGGTSSEASQTQSTYTGSEYTLFLFSRF